MPPIGSAFNGEEVMDIIDLFEVKEEILDDVEEDQYYEKVADPEKENVEQSCTCLKTFPIVYTTRLDDMNIFKKDISCLLSSSIINSVIIESKPKVTKCIVKIEKNENSNLRYMKLLNKLQQYNYNTSSLNNSSEVSNNTFNVKIEPQGEAKDRKSSKIQKLLELCKPLSVTLNNCEPILRFRHCTRHRKKTSSDEMMKCKKCVKLLVISNELKNNRKNNYNAKEIIFTRLLEINKRINTACIVMKNINLRNTEIYHYRLDLGTIIDYCYVNHIITTDKELSIYVKLPEIIEIFYCCSLKRDTNIKKLLASFDTETSLFFLSNRLSHLNLDKPCKRCPKRKRQTVSSSNNDPSISIGSKCNNVVSKMPSNRAISHWQQFLTSTDSNNANGFINKALKYAGKSQLQATVEVPKLPRSPFFVLHIKSNSYKTQHCIVREDCQVQSYFETHRHNKLQSDLLLTLKNSYLKNHNRYACCWVKHQDILSQFPIPVVDLLKKTIHDCPTGNCKCCCKSKMMLPPLKFKQIKLPETFNHTERYTKKLKEILRNVDKLQNTTMDQCKFTCKANINSSIMPSVLSPDQQINESIVQQQPTVSALIASIMHRFKHIKLSLSAEGKVQAVLDTPATTFSKSELKILSKILEYAQEQIKDLGIVDNSNNNLSDPLHVRNLSFSADSFHQRLTTELTNSSEVHSSNTGLTKHVTSNSDPLLIKDSDSLNEIPKGSSIYKINLENIGKTIHYTSDLYNTYRNFSMLQNEQLHRSFESYFKHRHPSHVKDKHGVNNSPLLWSNSSNQAFMPSITKVFSLNAEVGTQIGLTKSKPNAKRSSETISILENILTEKKPKLDIPSTSYQENFTTDETSGTVLQQKTNPITLKVIPSNPTIMTLINQPDYQYVKPEPDTVVHPVLIPVLTGNTDSVEFSVTQNRSLLQTMISPIVGSESLEIPQSHEPLDPLYNTVDNDDECILGV